MCPDTEHGGLTLLEEIFRDSPVDLKDVRGRHIHITMVADVEFQARQCASRRIRRCDKSGMWMQLARTKNGVILPCIWSPCRYSTAASSTDSGQSKTPYNVHEAVVS